MTIETYLQKLFENTKNPFRWAGQYIVWPKNWVNWDNQDKYTGNEKGTRAQSIVFQDSNKLNATDLKDSDLFIETLDLIQYIINNGIDFVLKKNSVTEYRYGKVPTIEDISNKISRAGFPDQALRFKEEFKRQTVKVPIDKAPTELQTLTNNTKKAGVNIFLVIGLIGAAFLMFKKK
jgi:hypothetical protein